MKRAFPQKVKSVSCHLSSGDIGGEQPKQAPLGVHRRTRTSAAMIGLALSMGASSLLLPRQNDGAAAAESISPESTFVTVPATPQAVVPRVSNMEAPTTASRDTVVIDHRVHSGQTLWQLARRYQVSVEAIAAATGIQTDTVLEVGQTVRIPVSRQVVSTIRPAAREVTPRVRPVSSRQSVPPSRTEGASERADEFNAVLTALDTSEALLRTERDDSLSRLRQERDKLRTSLSTLRGSTGEAPKPQTASVAVPQTAQPERIAIVDRPVVPQESVTAELETVIPQSAQLAEGTIHQVKPGETLGAIAQSYNVPQQALVEANQLPDPDWLRPNQALTIPQVQPETSAPLTVAVAPNLNEPTASPSLPVAPSLQPTVIQPEITPPAALSYQVNPGDTIAQIAQAHQISPSALAAANRLSNPDLIVVGQVIQIPAESSAPSATIPPTANIAAPTLIATTPAQTSPAQDKVSPADSLTSVPSVAVPTVPTVPMTGAIALAPSPTPTENTAMLSTEFSGDTRSTNSGQRVATAPLSVVPSTVETSPSPAVRGESNVFVQNLLAEIMTLRDRQRATTGTSPAIQEPTVVAAASSTLPSPMPASRTVVNPEFNPQQYNQSVEAVSPGFQRRQTDRSEQTPATSSIPQVVAAAPVGSESYAPLVRPVTGRMVSPDLPPLPGADTFLPDGAGVFNGYIWPARGVFTSGYGRRWGRMHRGIDIAAPVGTPVYAAAPGVVQFSGWNSGGYGNMVEIRHADGSMTRYAHNSRNLVRAGQRVEQGEQIAHMGSTGYSTGPHVHFEIHLPNQGTVNPIAYLPNR